MMGFGDKFNKWLKDNGKEELSEREIKIFNESGERVAKELKKHHRTIVKNTCDLADALVDLRKKMEK